MTDRPYCCAYCTSASASTDQFEHGQNSILHRSSLLTIRSSKLRKKRTVTLCFCVLSLYAARCFWSSYTALAPAKSVTPKFAHSRGAFKNNEKGTPNKVSLSAFFLIHTYIRDKGEPPRGAILLSLFVPFFSPAWLLYDF